MKQNLLRIIFDFFVHLTREQRILGGSSQNGALFTELLIITVSSVFLTIQSILCGEHLNLLDNAPGSGELLKRKVV